MLTVDDYGRIRRAHRDGMSIREIARQFHHSRSKVREVLRGSGEPPIFARRETQSFPKLGSVAIDPMSPGASVAKLLTLTTTALHAECTKASLMHGKSGIFFASSVPPPAPPTKAPGEIIQWFCLVCGKMMFGCFWAERVQQGDGVEGQG
jgi:hypothetical protein